VVSKPAPIGILGGTFDPIHVGHLRLAIEAAEACALAEVRLIPAGTPPHRPVPRASARQRLEMARIAAGHTPGLIVDDREAHKDRPCYTVETLSEMREELGDDVPLCLIVGADAFRDLPTWHRWRELFELAHFIIARRPGTGESPWPESLRAECAGRIGHGVKDLARAGAGSVVSVEIPLLDISASGIRARLAAGGNARYLLPDAVLDYIQANNLYSGG